MLFNKVDLAPMHTQSARYTYLIGKLTSDAGTAILVYFNYFHSTYNVLRDFQSGKAADLLTFEY